jgi:hypothetical protein
MTKIIYVKPIITDEKLDKMEGDNIPESHYKQIIDYDCDVYCITDPSKPTDKSKLLLKFRKNVIPQNICASAFWALEKHAQTKNHNRGAASGKLNIKKLPKYVGKITKKHSFRVFYKSKAGKIVRDNIGNMAMSNIAGYYDKPDRNNYTKFKMSGKNIKSKSHEHSTHTDKLGVPMCRTTKFTSEHVDKWRETLPLIDKADHMFKLLVPERHKIQLAQANKTPNYQIGKTAYSTITVNYNWRTAMHKDAGDLKDGFGNLIVCELHKSIDNKPLKEKDNEIDNDKRLVKVSNTCNYKGGYLGFPKWGIAVDVRQSDFLAMDVHEFHCNTPIIGEVKGSKYGRLSIVCYLREKMIKCSK